MSEEQRRQRAKEAVEQRRKQAQRDNEIEQKLSQANESAPDPQNVSGPPWNTAVLLYLQALDQRMDRIEEELGIDQS
jgi:hypothetical protein